jgi:hypothetical protein
MPWLEGVVPKEEDDSLLVLTPARSSAAWGVVLAKLASSPNDARLVLGSMLPMRSGMTSIAKAANEDAPRASATHGVHRQVSTLGSPSSRIREQA